MGTHTNFNDVVRFFAASSLFHTVVWPRMKPPSDCLERVKVTFQGISRKRAIEFRAALCLRRCWPAGREQRQFSPLPVTVYVDEADLPQPGQLDL